MPAPANVAHISIHSGLPLRVVKSNNSLPTPKKNPKKIIGRCIMPNMERPKPTMKCASLSFNF